MGRQINFFLHPDDQLDFDNLLSTFDDICFLAYYNNSGTPTIIHDTIIIDHLKEGSCVHLIRKQDLKNVKLTYIEKFNYWLIDNSLSPVLDFDRCVSYDNELREGRLYFQPKYVENQHWIEKDVDFVKWSERIIVKVRKFFKKYKYKFDSSSYEYTLYLSNKALKLIEEDKATIGLPGDRLRMK